MCTTVGGVASDSITWSVRREIDSWAIWHRVKNRFFNLFCKSNNNFYDNVFTVVANLRVCKKWFEQSEYERRRRSVKIRSNNDGCSKTTNVSINCVLKHITGLVLQTSALNAFPHTINGIIKAANEKPSIQQMHAPAKLDYQFACFLLCRRAYYYTSRSCRRIY